MITPFRLLKVGHDDRPHHVFVIWEDTDGLLWISDGNLSDRLPSAKALDTLGRGDLPAWVRRQGGALTLTRPEIVQARDLAETHRLLMEAAQEGYGTRLGEHALSTRL